MQTPDNQEEEWNNNFNGNEEKNMESQNNGNGNSKQSDEKRVDHFQDNNYNGNAETGGQPTGDKIVGISEHREASRDLIFCVQEEECEIIQTRNDESRYIIGEDRNDMERNNKSSSNGKDENVSVWQPEYTRTEEMSGMPQICSHLEDGQYIDDVAEEHPPSEQNRLQAEDEYSHPDIVRRRRVVRHLSYHDSDSDLVDYDYDDGGSIPGVDSDFDDADSWDWTFPDENVSDLDVKRVPSGTVNSPGLLHISKSSGLKAQKEMPNAKDDVESKVVYPDNSKDFGGTHYDHHSKAEVSDHSDEDEEINRLGYSLPGSNDNAFFAEQPYIYRGGKGKQITIEENVVYFEDSSSSHLLKTRLKYLYSNSDIGSERSRVLKTIHGGQCHDTCVSKNSPGISTYRAKAARKQFERRNIKRTISKLNDIEARFFAGHSHFEDVPAFSSVQIGPESPEDEHLVSSFLSSSLSFSFSKPSDTQQLPPVPSDKARVSLSNKRHSLNDELRERLITWKLSKGRAMTRPDVYRKSVTKEQIQRGMDDMTALRRRQQMTAFERFRHAGRMIILMLRAVGLKPHKLREDNYNFLSWTVMYDEVLGISRLNYDSGNLTFDPLFYKANKECTILEEVKDILRLPSDQRTDAHVNTVLKCFQNVVPSFSEFPIRIQQSMIKVCTYERFETGRVIIRQGHRAENFYFILSGCAVVTEMDSDANHVYTTNVLGKGNSFGELAFLNMAKRSATVTCREDVELICIEREDFIDIFMRKVKGKEPDHITFLKQHELLKEWPVRLLPHDNPKICAFTYVRRGVILCHDSAKSDWIIVVVSGSCKILKALDDRPVRAYSEDRRSIVETQKIKLAAPTSNFPKVYTTTTNMTNSGNTTPSTSNGSNNNAGSPSQHQDQQQHQKRVRRLGADHSGIAISISPVYSDGDRNEQDLDMAQIEHLSEINNIYYKKHVLPSIRKVKREEPQVNSSRRTSSHRLELPPSERLFRPKRQSYGLQPPALPQLVVPQTQRPSQKKVFIQVTRLEPGDVFGLDQVLLLGMRDVTSCSLVSEGAEVVLISKKFFKKYLTEETAKQMRLMIRPLPSEKTLQKNFNTKKSWDAFKAHTIAKHSHRKDRFRTFLQT